MILPYEMRWVDQVCLLDMASIDGTGEFCRAFLRPNDKYVRRERNTVPELGYAEARNAVGAMADSDWIVFSDADRLLDPLQAWVVKDRLENIPNDIMALRVETIHLAARPDIPPYAIGLAAQKCDVKSTEPHMLIVRNTRHVYPEVEFRGYIYECLYSMTKQYDFSGDHLVDVPPLSAPSGLRFYHFDAWRNDPLRMPRNAWMLRNAIRNPKLQEFTSRYWYDEYYPKHREDLERMAVDYEKSGAVLSEQRR